MKLVVPTNWDDELIDRIKDYPVDIIYAKLKRDRVGGGRPASSLPDIDRKAAAKHIRKVHEVGFKFNYILNAACLGNNEFLKKYQTDILKDLEWISKQNVEYVTVAIPFLVELIKRNFPNLKIVASVFLNINSIQKALYYQNLGVTEIVTDQSQNRNLKFLEKLKKSVKTDVQLVVNNICLLSCPYRLYHQNINSHASQIDHTGTKNVSDQYVTLNCESIRINNPVEIIKSTWIRPEDLKYYEKLGITHFKLSGRTKDTDWLVKVVKAYSTYKSPDNLAELLSFPIPSYMPSANVEIKNSELKKFIHGFAKKDCHSLECEVCGYCYKVAEKAVVINSRKARSVTKEYKKILDGMFF